MGQCSFFHAWGSLQPVITKRCELAWITLSEFRTLSCRCSKGRGQEDTGGPPPAFTELQVGAETSHAELNKFTANLDSATLSQTIRIPWFPDPPITVAQALVQVAMHTQHHRGQCMMLSEISGASQEPLIGYLALAAEASGTLELNCWSTS